MQTAAPFITGFSIQTGKRQPFPFNIPAVQFAGNVAISSPITLFIGDNGCGKSTLLETLALNLRLPLIGGAIDASSFEAATLLQPYLEINWHQKTGRGFFFRAEDFSHFIYGVERTQAGINDFFSDMRNEVKSDVIEQMSGRMNYSLREMKRSYGENMQAFSHGEAYLKILTTRINGKGIYFLDEPEAALSPARQLALLSIILEAVKSYGAQFMIATHSPIIMGLPGALLYEIKEDGMHQTSYTDTEHYSLTYSFLQNPEQFLRWL